MRRARHRARGAERRGGRAPLSRVPPAGRDGGRRSSRTAGSSSRSAASSRTSRARSRAARCCGRASACSSGRRRRAASGSGPTARSVEAERLVLTAGAWSQDVARLPGGLVRRRAPGPRLVPADAPELFEPDRMPVFNLALDGEHFYGFPAHGDPGLQARSLRPLRCGRRSGHDLARAHARRRGAAACVRRALLPGGRRADGRAQDVPLRALTGRALPDRPPSRTRPRPSSAPASPATASSSARSSARSSPTSRSTARRATTSACSASTASDPPDP